MNKMDLQPINDRIYELIGYQFIPEDEEEDYIQTDNVGHKYFSIFDNNNNEYDSIEDYNHSIVEQAIDQVLEELKQKLLQNWGFIN